MMMLLCNDLRSKTKTSVSMVFYSACEMEECIKFMEYYMNKQ